MEPCSSLFLHKQSRIMHNATVYQLATHSQEII